MARLPTVCKILKPADAAYMIHSTRPILPRSKGSLLERGLQAGVRHRHPDEAVRVNVAAGSALRRPRPAWREHVLLDHDVKGAEDDPEHGAHQPQHLERVPLVKRGAEDLPPAHGALQPSACSPASQ